ncbi:MAG: hypothetical protein WKG00_13535 [Polyangiaceae bacterium]
MRTLAALLLLALGVPACLLVDYEKADGSSPAPSPAAMDCCQPEPGGCADASIAACVCAVDAYCCETDWDESCSGQVAAFGCGGCVQPSPAAPAIDPECAADADCGPQAPLCVDGLCGQCRDDAGCAARDPALPHCGPERFCGECVTSVQCTAAHADERPVCHLGLCVACAGDAECADGAVCVDGTCM